MTRPAVNVRIGKAADSRKTRWWDLGAQFGVAAGPPSFVVSDFGGDFTTWAKLAKQAGYEIVRSDFSEGAATNFKSLHDACVAQGLEVMPLLIIKDTATKTQAQVLSEAADIVSRYPNVRKVELGNEVNGTSQWGATPNAANYVTQAAAAAAVLRAGNPNMRLCSAGLSQGSGLAAAQTYLQGMIDAGIASSVDAIGVHAYGAFGRDTFVPGLRTTLVTNGLSGKPIWVTECGAATTDGPYSGVTYAQQAAEIDSCFSTFVGYGYVEDILAYTNTDRDTTGGTTDQAHYGSHTTAGAEKDAAKRFATNVHNQGH